VSIHAILNPSNARTQSAKLTATQHTVRVHSVLCGAPAATLRCQLTSNRLHDTHDSCGTSHAPHDGLRLASVAVPGASVKCEGAASAAPHQSEVGGVVVVWCVCVWPTPSAMSMCDLARLRPRTAARWSRTNWRHALPFEAAFESRENMKSIKHDLSTPGRRSAWAIPGDGGAATNSSAHFPAPPLSVRRWMGDADA